MIIILRSDIEENSPEFQQLIDYLEARPSITPRVHREVGALQALIEIYLIGDTSILDKEEVESFAAVETRGARL